MLFWNVARGGIGPHFSCRSGCKRLSLTGETLFYALQKLQTQSEVTEMNVQSISQFFVKKFARLRAALVRPTIFLQTPVHQIPAVEPSVAQNPVEADSDH